MILSISSQLLQSYSGSGVCTQLFVCSYLSFIKSPGLGFSKVYEQSSSGVLEGVPFIFLKGIFVLQNNGKNPRKTEGLAGKPS